MIKTKYVLQYKNTLDEPWQTMVEFTNAKDAKHEAKLYKETTTSLRILCQREWVYMLYIKPAYKTVCQPSQP